MCPSSSSQQSDAGGTDHVAGGGSSVNGSGDESWGVHAIIPNPSFPSLAAQSGGYRGGWWLYLCHMLGK